MSERVNLYLPDGHWALDIPKKDRAKRIKEMMELGHSLELLRIDVTEIKKILLAGGYTPPPVTSKEQDAADKELILSILDM